MREGRVLVLCVGVLAVGCTRNLPPPEAPARVLPSALLEEVRAEEASEVEGVVAIDVEGEPAEVTDFGMVGDLHRPNTICTTPCVARLEQGTHRLALRRGETADEIDLQVTAAPRGYRRILSEDTGEHDEYISLIVGGILVGGFFAPMYGRLADFDQNTTIGNVGYIAGSTLATVALGAAIVGAILLIADPRVIREGNSTEWELTF
jgi:hypothetical protein